MFKSKPIDSQGARSFVQQYADKWDLSVVRELSSRDISSFLCGVSDSALGPDGISYSFWKAAGPYGASTLFEFDLSMKSSAMPPLTFNSSLMVFPPKTSGSPKNVRPLSLQNCDKKIIAGTNNRLYKKVAVAHTPMSQRGFVPSRQWGQNVLDLDAACSGIGILGIT